MPDDPPRDFGFDLFYAPCGAFEYCSLGPVSCCCALGCCSLQTWGAFHKQSGNVVPPGSGEIGYTERQVDCAVLFSVFAGMRGGEWTQGVERCVFARYDTQRGVGGCGRHLRRKDAEDPCPALLQHGRRHLLRVVHAPLLRAVRQRAGNRRDHQDAGVQKRRQDRLWPACRCWRGPESRLDCCTCACFSCVQPWDLEKNRRFVAPPARPAAGNHLTLLTLRL